MRSKFIINIVTLLSLTTSAPIATANAMDKNRTEKKTIPQVKMEYFSPVNNQTVCLYSDDKLQGNSRCFLNGEKMDLYEEDDTMIGNDKTSSIYIPDGMLATIYRNDDYNPPYFNLAESIGQRNLAALGMDNQISSVKVSNYPIEGCSKRCVILNQMQLPLSDIFSREWEDPAYPNKQVLLSFNINDQSDFMVKLTLGPMILFSKRDIFISNSHDSEPLEFRLHSDANRFSLLFHLNSNNVAVDYMESRDTEQIALSPTITWDSDSFDRPVETSAIIINNTGDYPLVIDQVVMAASAENIQSVHHRSERDTAGTLGCAFIPALAIYNYVTHSRCNQGDELWHKVKQWFSDENKDKSVLVAGDSSLLKPQPHSSDNSDAALTLTKIETQLHNQALTLPATAQFCKTSMENILAARYPRDLGLDCKLWVSRVLADFTLLFGDSVSSWTQDALRQLLTRIDVDDTTGFATSDPAAESRLVDEVRRVIEKLGREETIRQILEAFDYARLNYARYLMHNHATESPAGAQHLPLGTYSLSLASYHLPPPPPTIRILENHNWVTLPDGYFEVNILDTTHSDVNGQLMRRVRTALNSWHNSYHNLPVQYLITGEPKTEQDRTVEAAQINSSHLREILNRPGGNYVLTVTSIRETVHSILVARRDESFERSNENYEIIAFLTDPRSVFRPYHEGAIRGTGSAAIHQLARYLQDSGARVLRMRTVSQPSSRVATKLGFHHDEF